MIIMQTAGYPCKGNKNNQMHQLRIFHVHIITVLDNGIKRRSSARSHTDHAQQQENATSLFYA